EVPAGNSPWPAAATSDRDGRLVLRGVGAGLLVTLKVEDDRFAPQELAVATSGPKQVKEFSWSLAPAQVLEGRVLCDDTGEPVPGVRVRVTSLRAAEGGRAWSPKGAVEGRTDERGRFRLNAYAGTRLAVTAFAPAGGPYLTFTQ